MATDRLIHSEDPSISPEARPIAGGIAYKDIQDPHLRGALRTGEVLLLTAATSELVRISLLKQGKSFDEVIGNGDLIELSPNRVINRIKEVVGVRGALDLVESALVSISEEGERSQINLNGDGDLVEAELFELRAQLVEQRREEELDRRLHRILERDIESSRARLLATVLELEVKKS